MRMKSFVIASLPGPHYAHVWEARTKATVTIFIPTMQEHSRGPGVVILFPCMHTCAYILISVSVQWVSVGVILHLQCT